MHGKRLKTQSDRLILGLVLCLALIHSIVYFYVMPAWQHYDEPNHFEHVWLRASLGRAVTSADYNPDLSYRVMDSMRRNGFFKGMGFKPTLDPAQPIRILGIPQLDERPVYYWLASLVVRMLPPDQVQNGMYAARSISIFLFLITILAAWGFMTEVTPSGNVLRWMVPVMLAALPGFVDLMTAVNNDSAAVAMLSLTLWGSARLVHRGFSFVTFAWTAIFAGISVFTKTTAFIAVPIFGVAVLFSLFRNRWTWLAYGFLIIGILAGILFSVSWDDAALYLRSSDMKQPTRNTHITAPWGKAVLELNTAAFRTPSWTVPLTHSITPRQGLILNENIYTLGVWMWADRPINVQMPILRHDWEYVTQRVDLSTDPQFYAYKIQVENVPSRLWVTFEPRPADMNGAVIYYDGLLLLQGEYPLEQVPSLLDNDARQGIWGGASFTNLARNASFEAAGPRITPWIDDFGAKYLPDSTRPSMILGAIYDWQGSYSLLYASAARIFRTFWGYFGWAHIPLQGAKPYRPLLILTLVGLMGALWGLWHERKSVSWGLFGLISVALLLGWISVIVRSPVYLGLVGGFLPVARYGYPVIIPTAFVLCWGWLQVGRLLQMSISRISSRIALFPIYKIGYAVFILFFLALDIWAIYSITIFYENLLY